MAGGALVAGALVGISSPGARAEGVRQETAVASSSPVADVKESVVRVKVPLPASAGEHPAECDWLSYLRFRHKDGPARSADADRVLVAQPGILEGAGAFDSVARNTVVQAAAKGRHIEFWALDRRANCLEDNTGILAAQAAGSTTLAVDYYYRHKQVQGRTFQGFLANDQVGWLSKVGLAQTVRDQYDLMTRELPDPAFRRDRTWCGGHSLGGVLTGFFATWDFDGDHATTADAGFNNCAGYFALDTTVSTSLGDLSGMPGVELPDPSLGYNVIQAGLDSGILPRTVSAPTLINAETMNLLAIAGANAKAAPDGRSALAESVPRPNDNVESTTRFMFSKDLGAFLAGTPKVQDFNLSNEAALGGLMDDNSVPVAFIQSSVGFFDGGRIVDKEFPAANGGEPSPGLWGTGYKAIPDEPHGPLYTWRNYDRVGAPDDPGYASKDGKPFTTAADEVTDIQELARSLSEHPLDFTEDYFPTKIVTDIQLAKAPEVGADAVHAGGIKARPTLTVLAGEGLLGDRPPAELNPVIAEGYQHLDVLTAAPRQNNGRPEPASSNLASFVLGH